MTPSSSALRKARHHSSRGQAVSPAAAFRPDLASVRSMAGAPRNWARSTGVVGAQPARKSAIGVPQHSHRRRVQSRITPMPQAAMLSAARAQAARRTTGCGLSKQQTLLPCADDLMNAAASSQESSAFRRLSGEPHPHPLKLSLRLSYRSISPDGDLARYPQSSGAGGMRVDPS